MRRFYVISDEEKRVCLPGTVESDEEWTGPFETYDEAEAVERRLADACTGENGRHFRIECIDPDSPPPATD